MSRTRIRPGVVDPPGSAPGRSGNGDLGPFYRVVAQLDRWGHFTFTATNAYSGDNGRAAITNDENGAGPALHSG